MSSPRLPLGTRVYVHDPSRKGIIYRRGYVIDTATTMPHLQTLYDVVFDGERVNGLIREQLLTEMEMAERKTQGL